ncbi:TATA-binding protein-associated factor 172 [Thelohanellus kitauei]|uniref:TATA-binding protein-associated factor 172 n=1 Tax=Thelohanellus kitauei TaxID=669202 RepID=A0A0C2MZX8_THEKT|nr:TATA-binding protein-associated factor 172 [Thelohanellus kitauei]
MREACLKALRAVIEQLDTNSFHFIAKWTLKTLLPYLSYPSRRDLLCPDELKQYQEIFRCDVGVGGDYSLKDSLKKFPEIDCRVCGTDLFLQILHILFEKYNRTITDVISFDYIKSLCQSSIFFCSFLRIMRLMIKKLGKQSVGEFMIPFFEAELNNHLAFEAIDGRLLAKDELAARVQLLQNFNQIYKLIKPDETATNKFSYSKIRSVFSLPDYFKIKEIEKNHQEEFDKFTTSLIHYRTIMVRDHLRLIPDLVRICCNVGPIPDKITPIVFTLNDLICFDSESYFLTLSNQTLVKLIKITLDRPNPPFSRIIKNIGEKIVFSSKIVLNMVDDTIYRTYKNSEHSFDVTNEQGVLSIRDILSGICFLLFDFNNISSSEVLQQIYSFQKMLTDFTKHFVKIFKSMRKKNPDFIKQALNEVYSFQHHSNAEDIEVIDSMILFYRTRKLILYIGGKLVTICQKLIQFLVNNKTIVRYYASKCLSVALPLLKQKDLYKIFYKSIYPLIGDYDNLIARQGCLDLIYSIIAEYSNKKIDEEFLISMSKHLIIPLLARINDTCPQIRILANYCFSEMIFYAPATITSNECGYQDENSTANLFLLQQLINPSSIPNFSLPFKLPCELREYQQFGVNWLNFLRDLNLNGALCDDMGLGKTLQTLCIISSDHVAKKKISSLIICPKILVYHWRNECKKFIPEHVLKPCVIEEKTQKKCSLILNTHRKDELIIASYDKVKRFAKCFSSITWNYLVLDEAHVIKNVNSQVFKVCKELKARHKLALTGTPIQNDVLELWSIFNFLIPGFLGSITEFKARFRNIIIKSRNIKSEDETVLDVKTVESLHKRCLPFVLRRMKTQVLKDLPPKIIQNIYCKLSPIQSIIYKSITSTEVEDFISEKLEFIDVKKEGIEILLLLKQVCSHVSYFIEDQNDPRLLPYLDGVPLYSPHHNCKLKALKNILQICGFTSQDPDETKLEEEETVYQHKLIIFSQLRQSLNIIESHLLEPYFKKLSWLKLEGSMSNKNRFETVER